MAHLIDLSHEITAGMTTYPGLPGPELCDHLSRDDAERSYGAGTTFQIGRVTMVANTGTYLDSPFHRYPDGHDIAGYRLDQLACVDAVLVRSPQRAADVDLFAGLDVAGKAVLVHTGWDRHFGTDAYGIDGPFVTGAAAQCLADAGAVLVGIDSVNIDDMGDPARPAHTILLRAGVAIVEHLRGLDQLPESGFRFTAVPPRFAGLGTFPVRAFAEVVA